MTIIGTIKNALGAIINPATSEKQDTSNTHLTNLNAKDFSTETTLALIKAKTDNIDVAISTRTKPSDIQSNKPILQQDLIGNIKNGYADKMFGFVFGKNSNVDNTVVDLWEGPTGRYVFPTSPMQMQVSSTDNINDISGGTGALSVEFHYLDSLYNAQSETVILNGTTTVNTVATDILRINDFYIKSVGSSGVAAGNISLKNLGGTITYSYISSGFTASRQAIYTVPSGYNGYISHWQASSGSSAGNHFTQITLLSKSHDGVASTVFLPVDEIGTQDSSNTMNFPIPIRIPQNTDVKISAISDGGTANVTALGAIMGWFETI